MPLRHCTALAGGRNKQMLEVRVVWCRKTNNKQTLLFVREKIIFKPTSKLTVTDFFIISIWSTRERQGIPFAQIITYPPLSFSFIGGV
jgi:hypothetical protein